MARRGLNLTLIGTTCGAIWALGLPAVAETVAPGPAAPAAPVAPAADKAADAPEPSTEAALPKAGDAAYLAKLVTALGSDDSYKVRLQAAVFLGRTGDARAVEPLAKAMGTDEHYTVRAACATALANLGNLDAVAEIVRASAADNEAFVREEAGRALHKLDREQALPYVVAAYASDDVRVRTEVMRYLSEGSFDNAEVVLLRALGDEPEIVDMAQAAVRKMSPADRLRFLGTAVEHRDPAVRKGAVEVLRREGTADATQLILKVYERDIEVDAVRAATRDALRELRRFLPVEQIVVDARGSTDKHVRARALKLLGVVGGPQAQGALVVALTDREVYLRGTAVMALRELGDPAAIPELEKLLQDPSNQRIALQIRTAIKHLQKKPDGE